MWCIPLTAVTVAAAGGSGVDMSIHSLLNRILLIFGYHFSKSLRIICGAVWQKSIWPLE